MQTGPAEATQGLWPSAQLFRTTEAKNSPTVSSLIGHGTNNVAEYRAAIEGLKKAQSLGGTEIELRMDSQLVVEQINGRYKLKNATLKILHAEALELLKAFDWHAVAHVPRKDNQRADELANRAYATLPQESS